MFILPQQGDCPFFLKFNFDFLNNFFLSHFSRGGTICYFSVNIRDRFPGHMVLDAFCNNKTENNFENFENLFLTPPTRGLKNYKNPL